MRSVSGWVPQGGSRYTGVWTLEVGTDRRVIKKEKFVSTKFTVPMFVYLKLF